jgi:hypothetical protein
MNARQIALESLNALRADDAKLPSPNGGNVEVWKSLAAEFPHGADALADVAKLLGRVVNILDRALGDDPFAVRIDRDHGQIVGLIVCPGAFDTKIIPLSVREGLVILNGAPIFVARARGREALRLAMLALVFKNLETPN